MIITQTACSSEAEPVSVDNYYLDTSCNITVYGTGEYGTANADAKPELDEEIAKNAIDEAYALCAQMEKKISKTIEVSDVSRINNANGEWVEVCDWTAELLGKGIEYSKLSDGDFDITIGGVTALWDFHALEPKLPNSDELSAAAQHVHYDCIELDGNRVRLSDPAAQLDLGGIAKGYIGDKMADCLIENKVNSAIINLGGNIICIGSKPSGDDFSIGIETPYSDRSEISGVLNLSDKTAVTSGVYERYFEIDGKKYHHILSTETGYPVDSDVVAVSLVTDIGRSADIDALGTICLIKGVDQGLKLIESIDGVEACFTREDGSKVLSSGMEISEP
ncbi:MAG: FAD:protein FMN transferase [Clostridiales bacterium]|nr:FAD:protein FMN transferase [Candidatus Crickella caballi]